MKLVQIELLLVIILAVGSACRSTRKPGFPRQSFDEAKLVRQLEDEFDLPAKITDFYKKKQEGVSDTELRSLRNEVVLFRVALINLNYNQFVASFSLNKQIIDTTADLADFGVDLAATAVGSASTKTVLSSISAGISGSRVSIDKNFFYEKTVPVLVSTMNAERKKALAPILIGQNKSLNDYPIVQAISDLDAYYLAGTFLGALQSIQADAGEKESIAEDKLNKIRSTNFMDDKWGESIRLFWQPVNAGNQKKLLDWIKEHFADNSLEDLINNKDKKFVDARKNVIDQLKVNIPSNIDDLPEALG